MIHTCPAKFKAQGPNEVQMINDKLEKMIVGSPTTMDVKNYMILNKKYVGTTASPTM